MPLLRLGCRIKILLLNLSFFPSDTHKFFHHDRVGRRGGGGGTGLLVKKHIDVKKIDGGEKLSFEFSELRITFLFL